MRNKDFETGDNWYKKEKERESRISAWDFDEGKKVSQEHEKHCEREEVESQHKNEHEEVRPIETYYEPGELVPWIKPKALGISFVLLFVNWFLMFMNQMFLPNIINFLLINPGIFVVIMVTKGKPQEALSYWLLVIMYEIALLGGNIFRLFF